MNTTKAWYIRSQSSGETKGPFPGGQISQELLLGRYRLKDEVSHDKEEWLAIRDVPELIPEIFTENRDEAGFEDRLAAARRWADERRGVDAIDKQGERRANSSYEGEEVKRLHNLANKAKKPSNPIVTFVQLGFVFIAIAAVIVLAFQYSPKEKSTVDCSAPAKQGVNWSDCNLSGSKLANVQLIAANLMNTNLQTANLYSADLSHANLKYAQLHLSDLRYANFTKANLTGVNLMGSNLSGASFEQANLSYVNFRDANIETVNFSNARLDHAIWIDGRTCQINSIGMCK